VAVDPGSIAGGIAALKTVVDTLRSAIGLARDVQSHGGGSEKEKQAIDTALTIASSNAAVAEAQLAKAFGYELCKCRFPPVPMRTVGYFNRRTANNNEGDPVYECPECGFTNAGPYTYARIAPTVAKVSQPDKAPGEQCPKCGELEFRIERSAPNPTFGALGGVDRHYEMRQVRIH
jgi:predicted RNA-binding Zn-ribbon protein involved in translation (DUF1610 family)